MPSTETCLMSKYLSVQGKLNWVMLGRFAARGKEKVLTCEWIRENEGRKRTHLSCSRRWVHRWKWKSYLCSTIVKTWRRDSRDLFTWATGQVSGEVGLVESINPDVSLMHPTGNCALANEYWHVPSSEPRCQGQQKLLHNLSLFLERHFTVVPKNQGSRVRACGFLPSPASY